MKVTFNDLVQRVKALPMEAKITLVAFFSLLFFYGLFNWTMSAVVHSRKEVVVPDLQGKSLSDAVNVISPLNLGLRKEGEELDESIPAGTIIRQNPHAGMPVREGKIVRVTISQGGKMIYVPNTVGQTARSAEIMIRSSGLALGEESTRYSLVVKRDTVISQDPAAGSAADRDALVNLVISAGPPTGNVRLMPEFSGKNIAEAQGWAQQNNLPIEVREESNAQLIAGTVIRQEPAADTDLASVTQVLFVVASSGAGQNTRVFSYEVPSGDREVKVRITLLDDRGEKELFSGVRAPGTKLELPFSPKGTARVRIFVNGIMAEEKEIQ